MLTFRVNADLTVPRSQQIRIVAPAIDFTSMGQYERACRQVDSSLLDGVPPGAHWIRPKVLLGLT